MRTAAYFPLILVASGFLFCLISLTDADAISCSGGGCSLYSGLEFMGLSFYAWGTMLFALLIFAWGKRWFYQASLLALGADIPFLIWQGFMVPCTSCLTVSVMLTLNACMARAPARAIGPMRGSTAHRIVIYAAIALIGCGFLNLFKETISPWSINGHTETGRFLYFSPSCEPCRQHIGEKAAAGTLSQISLIPISRTDEDIPAIYAMFSAYSQDGESGLVAAVTNSAIPRVDELSLFERTKLTIRLHWNYGHLVRSGGGSLPWYSGQLDEPQTIPPSTALISDPTPSAGCGIGSSQCSTPKGGLSW